MSKDLDACSRSQLELYGRISRSHENLKKLGAGNVTIGVVEARLQALETNWNKFESQHERILTAFGAAAAEHDYYSKGIALLAEEAYLQQKGMFLDVLRTLQDRAKEALSPTKANDSASPRTTLPRIQLPQFSGRYDEWPSFRDLFHSIISKDAATTQVEKLHYLKTCLKGEAALVVRSLPTTDENFSRAWKVLTDHYENKRLLVRSYISQFTALTKLKGESATELRQLYHCVMSTAGSMESIGRPITRGEDLFVHSIVELLDPRSRREWENAISDSSEPPSYATLQQFLERRLHTLEALQPVKSDVSSAKPHSSADRKTRAMHTRKLDNKRGRCSLCNKDHYILVCEVYRAKTAEERKKHVEEHNLCLNCLGRHALSDCVSQKTCTACRSRHHTTIHDAFKSSEIVTTSHVSRQSPKSMSAVLLATARVRVTDRYGVEHTARALIDQGSESSLIAESLAQRLRLPRSSTSVAVFGVGGKQTGFARGLVSMRMSPLVGGSPMTVAALVFPRLTLYDSGIRANPRDWKHLDGITLADPDFLAADPVDILLGADVYASILQDGLRKGKSNEPVAQRTSLGWIISGKIATSVNSCKVQTYQCKAADDLVSLVQRFWQDEEIAPAVSVLTPEERECEEFFRRTHARAKDGRYMVRLPIIAPLPDFSVTRRSALRVLHGMEKRFSQDTKLLQLYTDFMRQYEDLGHMSRVLSSESFTSPVSYLPHHGVMRESSVTTKLRVVFNGSTVATAGESLNRHLMVGPNLLPPLTDVILRWRLHRYVLAADVEKMYRQILVHPDDRDLQRVIWRYSVKEDPAEYRLNTVTYGLACAPFLAMRTVRQLAQDEAETYPRGAAALLRDVYMDDILTGATTIEEAQDLQQQLDALCSAGGFPLRKWSANDPSLLRAVPAEHRMQQELRAWQPHEAHSTLGLRWHPGTDSFSFTVRPVAMAKVTKRSVLSLTARLFDPLGWLAPTVVRAKIAFQSTWLKGLDWDVPLDTRSAQQWLDFQDDLQMIEQIRVPRWLPVPNTGARIEVHGFADASERAYAAVVYLRTERGQSWHVRLVTAKTKVAPLKQISLPRLELCAATLLVRLVSYVRVTLGLSQAPLHLWSDSTVVLGWIQGHPTRWKTYVANRVSEIQTTVPEAHWNHIPGQENPADCASRGLLPRELVNHHLWWQGPLWLRTESSAWPVSIREPLRDDLPEKRVKIRVATTAPTPREEPAELLRFSRLHRLLRVTAWCRRWYQGRKQANVSNSDYSPICSTLSAAEVEEARLLWLRQVQAANYKSELEAIAQKRNLSKSNPLTPLNPFVDSTGILRVGGRLKHAILAYDERHPAILPSSSHFTQLVVEACHTRTLHGGVQLTLGLIRQRYWIPRGRALVKRIILRCVACVRWRAAAPQQLMGPLPRERVKPARPFLHTGVDYAGPIQLRTTKGRGHRAYKAFIAVFVCLSSKAVHLEVVSDYTAEAFLAAFRRFVSRRGLCSSLCSDCGTNFVGADAQLRSLFAASSSERRRIAENLATDQVQWKFNPPSAPHFGGIWEAAVKSLKHHLRRVLGEATLTFEEMSTLLAQIEACLNSRPLQALTEDSDDLAALTPGHFLIGSALTAVPEPSLAEQPTNRLSRWQLLQHMRDHFWERWSKEYLHSLAYRPKWWKERSDFKVGRLCLIRHENTPPTKWPLARITRVHPGDDGLIRVVTVRTAASEFVRPITKLVLLPVSNVEASPDART